jgi:sarcosine oxidase/L-pipecolate oxidase
MTYEQGLFETEVYDHIVVGAGIEGSATAYYLAKNGYKTLLIEQFRLPHTRGSSHGASRLTRKAYTDAVYVDMMKEAFEMWFELERESGENLYKKLGLLVTAPKTTGEIKRYAEAMKQHDLPFTVYSASEIRNKYPQLKYGNDWVGLFDPEGGILKAEKCLASFQKQFLKFNGTLKDGERVNEVIQLTDGNINLLTSKGNYQCKSIVLCLGAWAGTFLKKLGLNLPLQPQVVKPCYWRETKVGAYTAGGSFPCILSVTEDHTEVYGLPADEYHGLYKFTAHKGLDIDHPDNRDTINTDALLRIPKKYIEKYMNFLDTRANIIETCVYTVTPDENFILDKVPNKSNIIVGAGFSGHGFKFGPIVGKILGSLATGKKINYDLTMFKISRFDKNFNKASKL